MGQVAGELYLGDRGQEKFPRGARDQELGMSLQGTGFGSRKIPRRIKRIRKNPPEDFRQGEFPMKEMSVVYKNNECT
jgi:hypothetical protein